MFETYEYRIYPNKTQQILLAKHFGCVRLVYNKALNMKETLWENNKEKISCVELTNELINWKKTEELSFLYEVSSTALQQAIQHLDAAYTNYFRIIKENDGKVKYKKRSLERQKRDPNYILTKKDIEGYPRYKSKRDGRQSYSVTDTCYVDFDKNRVRFPKFQEGVKARIDRTFEGEIKTCTIKKTCTGKYFISVLVDDGKQKPSKLHITKETAVGIDLGIKTLAVISNGDTLENMHFLTSAEERLKVLQRRASKKVKGSNRQKKASKRIALLNEKIRFQRKDYIHKFTSRLINDSQVNTICLEDLNVKGMMQNHKIGKPIQEVAWNTLVSQLAYKAEWARKNILRVDRFYPSSKTCNSCGYIKDDLTLNDREWSCPICRVEHDRDFNASLNIRDEALRKYFAGQGMPEELMESPALVGTVK